MSGLPQVEGSSTVVSTACAVFSRGRFSPEVSSGRSELKTSFKGENSGTLRELVDNELNQTPPTLVYRARLEAPMRASDPASARLMLLKAQCLLAAQGYQRQRSR